MHRELQRISSPFISTAFAGNHCSSLYAKRNFSISVLPALQIPLWVLESRENCSTDHCPGLWVVGLESPPSSSSPRSTSPGVPWWDAILVLVIVASSLTLDFLFWSVPVCCQTEQARVIISAASQPVPCRCVSAHFALKGFQAFVCFPAPLSHLYFLSMSCDIAPFLPRALCIFLHLQLSCLQFCTPGFSQKPGCSLSLCVPGPQGFLPFVGGPQLIFSPSCALHLSWRGSFILPNAYLLHTIFLFPFLSQRLKWSLAKSQCYNP